MPGHRSRAAPLALGNQGVFVYTSHSEVWTYNKEKIFELIPRVSPSTSYSSDGLLSTLNLAQNAKVTLTENLCVPFGLLNGAVSLVQDKMND